MKADAMLVDYEQGEEENLTLNLFFLNILDLYGEIFSRSQYRTVSTTCRT
jgi:hypothetical protein